MRDGPTAASTTHWLVVAASATVALAAVACHAPAPKSAIEAAPEKAPKSRDASSDTDLMGIWEVVGHRLPGVSAMSAAEAESYHGETVRLTREEANSGADRCQDPSYQARTVHTARFLATEFHLRPASLVLGEAGERLRLLEVECEGEPWAALGGRLLLIAEDRALAPWDGVFFQLEREGTFAEVGFRATGNEPFWWLEITEGQHIRFAFAVEGREVYTPVPNVQIDEKTGTRVYHAVTEANDLRVEIERKRCIDDMSGRPHEATVMVTLNGETYRGCGESGGRSFSPESR